MKVKTDYRYFIRRIEVGSEIVYEVNRKYQDRNMKLLALFKGIPGENNFRLIEESGGKRYFHGLVSPEKVESELLKLAEVFHADDFMARLEAMRGQRK